MQKPWMRQVCGKRDSRTFSSRSAVASTESLPSATRRSMEVMMDAVWPNRRADSLVTAGGVYKGTS